MNMDKSVLLTGAAGFIGGVTATALEQAGWAVTRGVRSPRMLEHGSCHLDLDKPAALLAMANDVRFDAIVHLGAHIGWSGATEAEMFAPNVLATGCLAFLARQWNAQLLFASAAIVSGARTPQIGIGSPVVPDTAYARSKWLGEQLITASHAHHCILRIAGVFGSGGPSHLGINRAIDDAMNGMLPTQIGTGDALRNYIYVKDAARAIIYALQNQLEGTHLLAGSEVTPISRMLQEICDVFLPGRQPTKRNGQAAMNQVIEPSPCLPRTMGFHEALADIKDSRP